MKIDRLFSVQGLSVLITGGASGIGLAYAQALAENGARLMIADINQEALDKAVTALTELGAEVAGERIDVTRREDLDRVVANTVARYGRIDVVFVNAGISGGPGFLGPDRTRKPERALEFIPDELWTRVIETNLTSVFRTVQAVVPQMKRQGGGRIIVTSSISATKTEIYVGAAYVASKAGVAQFVRQAAIELAKFKILVNAIAPGPVITNIGGGRLKENEARKPFEQACPMHEVASPDDLKGAAIYLASPASRFVTGAQIVVDGGVTLGEAD
jgi:NAD(P)-dependent dehydrogenase (short-subunit alcohol dehydrogenase family)